ncbi:uncharacterized protein LOC114244352 [Bombyx mandarina]|uniref:Uncharacterized protein n=2 Tax=Bombyx TaxID=7090 RepID=A0A8R1WHW1_BOMMO|nr:uncharacterized protein LOC101745090 [Bombyx mori]XP_028031933.1 uncharacterized protein LOC114244352 [Bombyx mandarina]
MSATLQSSLKEKIKESVEIPILTRCCFCFPLRRGLIAFAYTNLILTLVVTSFLSLYISVIRNSSQQQQQEMASELIRLIVDTVALLIEVTMTTVFVVALHKKHVLLMKLYLYFEIIYSTIGFAYSLAFINKETASELFLILFQLTLQIYLVILIWSSIVKMERDGSVKYTRESGTA